MADQGSSISITPTPAAVEVGLGDVSHPDIGVSLNIAQAAQVEAGFAIANDQPSLGTSSPVGYALPQFGTPLTGAATTVKIYIMAAYNTVTSSTEYWLATGAPNSNNPSGQAILANSLRIHSKYNA